MSAHPERIDLFTMPAGAYGNLPECTTCEKVLATTHWADVNCDEIRPASEDEEDIPWFDFGIMKPLFFRGMDGSIRCLSYQLKTSV